jgi:predicted  nucleic acid-binding Zn-ribbon protein
MTDTEHRLSKLEDKYHSVDTRQQTFEEFTRENLKYIKEAIAGTNERMNRLESKVDNLSNQMHNLIITGAIGIAAIVVAIALK